MASRRLLNQLLSEPGIQCCPQPGPNQTVDVSLPFSCYQLSRFPTCPMYFCFYPFAQVDLPSELLLCPLWKSIWFIKAYHRDCHFHKAFPRPLIVYLVPFSESSWMLSLPFQDTLHILLDIIATLRFFSKFLPSQEYKEDKVHIFFPDFIQHTLFSTFYVIGPLLYARDGKLY